MAVSEVGGETSRPRAEAQQEKSAMPAEFHSLKEWTRIASEAGEVVRLQGVHWDKQMGLLTQLARRKRQGPALLFDRIVDYQEGYRVLVNALGSTRRLALTLRLGEVSGYRELVDKWKAKWKALVLKPPRWVKSGPVQENRLFGDEVDLARFPAPLWHEEDGGRYVGTGCAIVMKDPESNWVNVGTYRIQVQGKDQVTCHIGSSHHGAMIRDKYFQRGEPCPVLIVLGYDPLLLLGASSLGVPHGRSEYDYVGGIKGEPIDVIPGEVTGLPMPAQAEAVLEGYLDPEVTHLEGPFGEYTGYYASGQSKHPSVQLKAVYFQSQPILLGSPPTRPPNESSFVQSILHSGSLEEELKGMGIPGVQGAWFHEAANPMLVVISIRQQYPGHAKQVLVGASNTQTTIHSKIIIVVDEDVDVTDLDDVMWAVCTRIDPARDTELLRRCPSNFLDPAIPPGQPPMTSRLLIDATRPYEWRERFARPITLHGKLEDVPKEWRHLFE